MSQVTYAKDNPKHSKLQIAGKAVKVIIMLFLLYIALFFLGQMMLNHAGFIKTVESLTTKHQWVLLLLQFIFICSSLIWYPLIMKSKGHKEGWSAEKIQHVVNKKWSFLVFFMFLVIIVKGLAGAMSWL